MSRIKNLFERKSKQVLNVYCTAGYPTIDSTIPIIKALEENGADIVELGMPYSDPLADGPVIQESSMVALQNGMSIQELMLQLKGLRKQVQLPVVLMGYMNPVLQYGFEKFCEEAAACGVDGLIIPDLPPHEFETTYSAIIKKNQLDFIFLITPETTEERIRKLDSLSSGFLYAVSSSSTTGTDKDMPVVKDYLKRLRDMQLSNPILVGFGIKDSASFEEACIHANGAIIGTAFIKALKSTASLSDTIQKFLGTIVKNNK